MLFAPSRELAAPLIVSRHTQKGVYGWEPTQQARYLSSLAGEDMSIDDLARLTGMERSDLAHTLRMDGLYRLACGLELPDDERAKIRDPRMFNYSTFERLMESTPALNLPLAVDSRDQELRTALAELALANLWRRDHDADFTPLGNAAGPLARWQGRVIGREADADATGRQVLSLWDMIQRPTTKAGRFARAHFTDAFVEYCASTSRPLERDDIDWTRARSLAECLGRVPSAERSVLSTLARECGPAATWLDASRIVADAHAPPALRAAWSLAAGPGAPGRPRRDPTRPPPNAERAAWGSDVLAAALAAWQRARSASA